jgi:cytoskeletal protein RodZ
MYRATLVFMLILATTSWVSACNRAASPEAAANDIAEAKQSAAQEVADAQRDASKEIDKADRAVQDKSSALADTNVKAQYDVAVATADGTRKIAMQQCMLKEGDAQRLCKEQADADYDAATAHAKAAKAAAEAQ